MNPIQSRQNAHVKRAVKLHQKRYREKEGLFIMEGVRALDELIKFDYPVDTLYYSHGVRDRHFMVLVELLSSRAKNTFVVTDEIMDYLSPATTSQKILTLLPKKEWDIGSILEKGNLFLALNRIQDPGNLGTIIRSAKAFSCDGIFLTGPSVEWLNPKVVRASVGYILDMPFFAFTDEKSFIEKMDEHNIQKIAFTAKAKVPIKNPGTAQKTVCIMGGETEGLGEILEKTADIRMKIPMHKGVESLNLSVSASIVLYEMGNTDK